MLPESYLLVFISGKNRPATIPPHASFKLSQSGESLRLYDSFKTLMDSVSVPFISTDFSYGSFPDGNAYRAFFEAPTPNGTNNNSEVTDHIIAFAPQFSHKTGVYSNTFSASNVWNSDSTWALCHTQVSRFHRFIWSRFAGVALSMLTFNIVIVLADSSPASMDI